MILLLTVIYLYAGRTANAIPTQELNTTLTPSATANILEPPGKDFLGERSVLDIIWSCFATIFACTWVGIHPNIPSESDSEWRIVGRRLKIMVYALLMPELILYWASKQWLAAKIAARKHAARGWTKTHGFFIGMGGFVLYEDGKMLRPLDIDELEDFCELGKIDWPEVSEKDILDKSKRDYFAQGVVIAQTTWFMLQSIARGVLGLAVTELELVTLAFAALSATMYFFWWDKPVDVRRPIRVHSKGPTVLMQFAGRRGKDTEERDTTGRLSTLNSKSQRSDESPQPPQQPYNYNFHQSYSPIFKRTRSLSPPRSSPRYFHLERRLDIPDEYVIPQKLDPLQDALNGSTPPSYSHRHSHNVTLESQSLTHEVFVEPRRRPHLQLHSSHYPPAYHIPKHVGAFSAFKRAFIYPIRTLIKDVFELKDSGNFLNKEDGCCVSPFYAALRLDLQHRLSIFFLVTSTVFGSLHCIAWGFEFPSIGEKWLWRAAAMAIMVLPSLFGLHWMIMAKLFVNDIPNRHSLPVLRLLKAFRYTFYSTATPRVSIMFGIYIVARMALLILPLLSLRALPSGAYISISWANFMPHV